MVISIFYLLIFIYLIFLLVKGNKNNKKHNWNLLFITIGLSLLTTIIITIYSVINIVDFGWYFLAYIGFSVIAFIVYFIIFIIGIVMSIIKSKDNKNVIATENEKNNNKKYILSNCLIILFLLVITLILENVPYKIKDYNDKKKLEKSKVEVINILNVKYGEGNFKIKNVEEKNGCLSCAWLTPGVDVYEFSISTNFLEDEFTISLRKDDLSIYNDEFLEEYYQEKHDIDNLNEAIIEHKINKINEIIGQNFNVKIKFNNTNVKEYTDKIFRNIPTLDELSEFAELEDPKFDINEDLKTKEELLSYLEDLTKYYIENYKSFNFSYQQTDKYFRYKYDYSKLGVKNYTDQYNGYGGYVLAGEYKYSDEEKRYILYNEDNIVRINVLGRVTTYKIEDILK